MVLDAGISRSTRLDTPTMKNRLYSITNSYWTPVPVDRHEQEGDTIIVVNDDFQDYFDEAGVTKGNEEFTSPWNFTLNIKSEKMDFDKDAIAKHFDSD